MCFTGLRDGISQPFLDDNLVNRPCFEDHVQSSRTVLEIPKAGSEVDIDVRCLGGQDASWEEGSQEMDVRWTVRKQHQYKP